MQKNLRSKILFAYLCTDGTKWFSFVNNMKRIRLWALCLMSLLAGQSLSAQNVTISTNLLDLVNVGTINGTASVALSQHFSLGAEARYNNWSFGSMDKGNAFQNRSRSAAMIVRYWPWTSFSSWYFGLRGQLEEYNRGGWIFDRRTKYGRVTEEGIAYGAGLSVGYQYLIAKHLNLDLGLGLWAGRRIYTQYACPRCGRIVEAPDKDGVWYKVKQQKGLFVLPSPDVQVSLVYVF